MKLQRKNKFFFKNRKKIISKETDFSPHHSNISIPISLQPDVVDL